MHGFVGHAIQMRSWILLVCFVLTRALDGPPSDSTAFGLDGYLARALFRAGKQSNTQGLSAPSPVVPSPVRSIASKGPYVRETAFTSNTDLFGFAGQMDIMSMRTIKPIELLVPVSFMRCRTSTPGLSTWSSSTALIGNTRFQVGFPLRCLQRLSRPYIATLLCRLAATTGPPEIRPSRSSRTRDRSCQYSYTHGR